MPATWQKQRAKGTGKNQRGRPTARESGRLHGLASMRSGGHQLATSLGPSGVHRPVAREADLKAGRGQRRHQPPVPDRQYLYLYTTYTTLRENQFFPTHVRRYKRMRFGKNTRKNVNYLFKRISVLLLSEFLNDNEAFVL